MKYPFILILLFSCWCSARSQTKVSLKAGINFSKVSWKESRNSTPIDNKFNTGYNLGLLALIPVELQRHNVYLQTGLSFTTKGYRQDYEDDDGAGILSINPCLMRNGFTLVPGLILPAASAADGH
ncbi:PorT family protein [Niabella beijingensis]|uniref:PorT family protein n=1 Tax=Niabella beijingensis TaxID=2872700 RepID=UPI001CBADC0D|nr:PorT family protein [Niabella beijingensis]MBZ4187737.1 PorT family protein [Niabella beijingensis]